MNDNDSLDIKKAIDHLSAGKLGEALTLLKKITGNTQYVAFDGDVDDITRNYNLMLGYMQRGFNDPQRGDVYGSLTARAMRTASDMMTEYKRRNVPFFIDAARRAANTQFTHEHIKNQLEGFVTDVAMLSLEADAVKEQKGKDIYNRHNMFMQALFCHIVASRLWNDADTRFYEEVVLSPTTDTNDAQLMVSAISIAALNNTDTNKTLALIDIYIKATDEKVRQKALIGWVFSLSGTERPDPETAKMLDKMLADENIRNEIADLQKQTIFCMNAEQDHDKIQRDIMPELMKNNNLNITRFGISEKEEDPMQDILDPGASERAMEKMEESFGKMLNMQKAGSDIYFGGFSQMKRFAFFNSAANWFCPFYIEHPEISTAANVLKETPLLTNILNNGPFCDSDKYSFTLAISSVISRLPANMREMISSNDALGQTMSMEEQNSAAYIRRTALQDMYRFYRLYQQRSQIVNPFDKDRSTFVAGAAFRDTEMAKSYAELCRFMLKHNNIDALDKIMSVYEDDMGDPANMMLHGIYALNYLKEPQKAVRYLKALVEQEPDNRRALSLLARASFGCGDLKQTTDCYAKLYQLEPSKMTTALNYCIAMTKAKMYQEAVNLLYRLDIEHPDSMQVTRVLAWTLMGLDKFEQAEKSYSRLLASEEVETGDWLNAGYCQWFKGDIAKAVKMFIEFTPTDDKNKRAETLRREFEKDKDVLADHGISQIDIQLMVDLASYISEE